MLTLLLAASLLAAPTVPPDTTLKEEKLAEGIYLFRAPTALDVWTATNAVVIINEQDVTVFDSNTRPATARLVLARIHQLTNKPVRWLINSHWHMDHWQGNAEYVRAYPGVQIVATTQTRDYLKRMAPRFFANEARNDAQFAKEVADVPHVLPNVVFRDTLIFWSGPREFRLFSATGDATGCAVLYLPGEKLLVTGDVLVAPEDGDGPPPWTTNSYAIEPWLASLRALRALDANIIVPGQGPAFHDKTYLTLTTELFASVVDQVHAALERGLVTLPEVQRAVDVDSLVRRYRHGGAPPEQFRRTLAALTKKAYQEALDGAGQE